MDMNHNIVTIFGICTEIQTTCMVVSQIGGHTNTQMYGKVNEQYWLVVLTILKNISQWEGLSHISWKIKHIPNHQPEYDCNDEPWENGVPYFETRRRGVLYMFLSSKSTFKCFRIEDIRNWKHDTWANYNNSLTWILRPFGDDFPYELWFPVRENSELVIIYPDDTDDTSPPHEVS